MKKQIILITLILTILLILVYGYYKYTSISKENGGNIENNIVDNDYDKWIGTYAGVADNVITMAKIWKVDNSLYLSVDITNTSNSNINITSSQGIITLLDNTQAQFDTKNILNNVDIQSLKLINDTLYINLLDDAYIQLQKLNSTQKIQEVYNMTPFSYIDCTLNEIPLEYTSIILSSFGKEINREYYSFEDETRAKINYEEGVSIYASFKENTDTIECIIGYDVTSPSIVTARGIQCGNSIYDVIGSFVSLLEQSSIEKTNDKENIKMIYGEEGYMNTRAYIEYKNGILDSVVYKNEECTIIFFVDNNMNVSKISYRI